MVVSIYSTVLGSPKWKSLIKSIWWAISQESAAESPYAMPITRDMSVGKRLALHLWICLVANNYKVQTFGLNSIPAGWTPPTS
jgi:hypothetical protein